MPICRPFVVPLAEETVRGRRVVRAFGLEPREGRRFQDALSRLTKNLVRLEGAPVAHELGRAGVGDSFEFGEEGIGFGNVHVRLRGCSRWSTVKMVVDDLLGIGTCHSTGESGARTSWVMDQMLAGYRSRQG